MKIEEIQSLAEILVSHGLSVLEVDEGGLRVRMEKAVLPSGSQQSAEPRQPTSAGGEEEATVNFGKLLEVKSPMVGVFYAQPSPDAEPFVHIGSQVKKGDVLCIVEAMKLMNEITAEQDGEIMDVCVRDGDVVEFGQTLFKMY